MEGQPSTSRKPRATGPRQKKTKPNKPPTPSANLQEQEQSSSGGPFKVKAELKEETEPMQGIEQMVKAEPVVKQEPLVKSEPMDEERTMWPTSATMSTVGPCQVPFESRSSQDVCDEGMGGEGIGSVLQEHSISEQGPVVKAEPVGED